MSLQQELEHALKPPTHEYSNTCNVWEAYFQEPRVESISLMLKKHFAHYFSLCLTCTDVLIGCYPRFSNQPPMFEGETGVFF